MKFHEDLQKRDQQVAELQAQLEALREQNEQLKVKLNEKNTAAAAAATSNYNVDGSASTMMSTSQTQMLANLAGSTQSISLVAGQNGYGNESANQSSSIVEVRVLSSPPTGKIRFLYFIYYL